MKYVITSLALVLSTLTFAQDAKTLLAQVETNLRSYSDQSIQFTRKLDFPTGNPQNPRRTREGEGSVLIVGDNFRVNTDGQIIFINGSNAYIVNDDDREVNIRNLSSEETAFTPNGVLQRFKSGSSLALAGSETVNGKKIQFVKVRPNGSEEIRDIVLGIDMSTKRVYSYTEYGFNDVITTITITNYQVNKGVNASEVSFNRSSYPTPTWRINEPRGRR